MLAAAAAPTWGIPGSDFLLGYAGLMLAATLLVLWRWRAELGPRPRSADASVDVTQLALLAGGPQLAVTVAATQLHLGRHLATGPRRGTLVAGTPLPVGAGPLERAVFDAVERAGVLSTRELRSALSGSDAIAAQSAQLTRYELLLTPAAVRRIHLLWLGPCAVTVVGVVRLVAGASNHAKIGDLTVLTFVALAATVWLAARQPAWATARGKVLLAKERRGRRPRGAARPELPLAVALFGGAALWSAEPALAKTLGVSRAIAGSTGDGGYFGGFFGGSSCGGSGGCGGGGCGGGGCGGCGG